ncbi:unnamed protein product, partial [Rotaria sp. Silwood2]
QLPSKSRSHSRSYHQRGSAILLRRHQLQ